MINKKLSFGSINDDDIDIFEVVFNKCESIEEIYDVAELSDLFSDKPRIWLYSMALKSESIRKKIFPESVRKYDRRERYYMVNEANKRGLLRVKGIPLKIYAYALNSCEDAYDLSKRFNLSTDQTILIIKDVANIRKIQVPESFNVGQTTLMRFFEYELKEKSMENQFIKTLKIEDKKKDKRRDIERFHEIKRTVLDIVKDGPKPILYILDELYSKGIYLRRRQLFERRIKWKINFISDGSEDKRIHFYYVHPSINEETFPSTVRECGSMTEMIEKLNSNICDGGRKIGEYTILYYMRKLRINDLYERYKRTKTL